MACSRLGTFVIFALGAAALVGCGDGDATGPNGNGSDDDFEWSGTIAQGDQIEIKGVQGSITASGTSGGQVEVSATKSGQQDDPSDVTIEVIQHSEGVTICAVYPDVPGQTPNECLPGEDQGNIGASNNDVQVAFTVSVPAGVVFVARNISGAVVGTDLQSEAKLTTISGDVTVETSEIAEAATISGRVTATIGRANWDRNLSFGALGGNVDVEIPSNTNAQVVATTVSGNIDSDFDLFGTDMQQQGTLGTGGPTLMLATISGNIRLRSGPASQD